MRNVIKNILSNWRNPLGRKKTFFPPGSSLPYTFTTPISQVDITVYSGYNVPFTSGITFYRNGTIRNASGVVTVPMSGFGITITTDPHTPCTITAQDGDCSYLEINGVIIFDNR